MRRSVNTLHRSVRFRYTTSCRARDRIVVAISAHSGHTLGTATEKVNNILFAETDRTEPWLLRYLQFWNAVRPAFADHVRPSPDLKIKVSDPSAPASPSKGKMIHAVRLM